MELDELKIDCSKKQKKGLHFILASIFIWTLVLIVELTSLPILTKNLLVFCCTVLLMPLSLLLSKLIKIDFQNKENPLSKLGFLLSMNQMVYLLIAMWVFSAVPDKMLMVFAIIFGAHLMPFSWLYDSKSYLIASIFIPIMALVIGHILPIWALAAIMIAVEMLFSALLIHEIKKIDIN